jgi:hypothetical protein
MLLREEHHLPPRQRSPRTDPDLRDGDSGHGNPGEPAGDRNALDTDTDIADTNEWQESMPDGGEVERRDDFEALQTEFIGQGRETGHGSGLAERAATVAPDRELPIRDYKRLTVPEVVRLAGMLTAPELATVLEYEKTHRNRKTLVAKLTKLASENARPTDQPSVRSDAPQPDEASRIDTADKD